MDVTSPMVAGVSATVAIQLLTAVQAQMTARPSCVGARPVHAGKSAASTPHHFHPHHPNLHLSSPHPPSPPLPPSPSSRATIGSVKPSHPYQNEVMLHHLYLFKHIRDAQLLLQSNPPYVQCSPAFHPLPPSPMHPHNSTTPNTWKTEGTPPIDT